MAARRGAQRANLGAAVASGDRTAIRRTRRLARAGSAQAGRILASAGVSRGK